MARYDAVTVTEDDVRRAEGFFESVRQTMRATLKV